MESGASTSVATAGLPPSRVADGVTVARYAGNPPCPRIQTNSRLARRAVSIVIDPWRAPDLGRVGGDVGDSGSPYAQGKHRPATGCHAPGRRPGSRPGPHLDQNLLAGYAAVVLALILDPRAASFPTLHGPVSSPLPPLAQRGTRKSRLETKTENEANSALLARLWCHLPLQNPANCAENLIRLCSATIGQTGWRMVQVGAIRSRQKAVQLLAEILKKKSKWRFRRFRVSRISGVSGRVRTGFARRLFYALSGFNHDAHFVPSSSPTVI